METDQSTSADDAAETDMRETVKMYERKLKDLEAEFERCLGELKVTTSTSEKESHPPTDHALPYKKEFKMQVQIGDPGQRDQLAFMSLVHQIDSGLKRGYPEKEIVEAVVRAEWYTLPTGHSPTIVLFYNSTRHYLNTERTF